MKNSPCPFPLYFKGKENLVLLINCCTNTYDLNTIRQRRRLLNLNPYSKLTSYSFVADLNFVFVLRDDYWIFLASPTTQERDLHHYQVEFWLSGKD